MYFIIALRPSGSDVARQAPEKQAGRRFGAIDRSGPPRRNGR
jgi:hypothetical protein